MSRSTVATSTYTSSAMTAVANALPNMYRANDAVLSGMSSKSLLDWAQLSAISANTPLPNWIMALPETIRTAIVNPNAQRQVIEELARPLTLAESLVITQAVNDSLASEGFMTRSILDDSLGFVEARRGHETVLVKINGTRVTRDRAGLDDATCAESDAAFEAQMAKRGIRLISEEITEHRNIPGGELIRIAARHNRRNLAQGAAQAHRATRNTTSSLRKWVSQ